MNLLLRDKLVRQFFGGGGGGGGGNREGEVTARMNRFVAQTETDANRLISAVTALGTELKRDAQNLSQDFLKGISTEEKTALDRLERANNWLSDETNRASSTFATELRTALSDLESASRTLNLGERDQVTAQINEYRQEAQQLDTQLRSDVSTALDRMDAGSAAAVGDFRSESLGLGDRFLEATRGAMNEYRGLLDEAGDLSPERLQKFTQAADFLSQAAVRTRADMLATADPRALELSQIADNNAAAMMSGQISADVQANLARSSAMRALQGGFGASSEMGRGLTARDLGLTSLDLQQRGTDDFERQRMLNFQTRAAGLQADSGQLLANDQMMLERRGGSLLEAGLRTAESDRNQRQGIADTALGARLSTVDTRRAEDVGTARGLYDTGQNRAASVLGLNLANTRDTFNRDRDMAQRRFDTNAGLSGRLFDVGLNTAGTLYGTNVNAANTFYNTGVNSLGSVFGTRMQASGTAISMRDVAERQKLAAMTQVRSNAAAMIEQAAEADYQQRMASQAANNSMWGSIIGTGATVLGGAVGTAVGGPVGGMVGSTLGGMAGQAAAGSLGYGGSRGGAQGMEQGMSAVGMFSSALGGRQPYQNVSTFGSMGAAQSAAPYASSFTNLGSGLFGSGMGWVPRATAVSR